MTILGVERFQCDKDVASRAPPAAPPTLSLSLSLSFALFVSLALSRSLSLALTLALTLALVAKPLLPRPHGNSNTGVASRAPGIRWVQFPGKVPREQKMLKGHLPRVIYHQVYLCAKKKKRDPAPPGIRWAWRVTGRTHSAGNTLSGSPKIKTAAKVDEFVPAWSSFTIIFFMANTA